MANRFLVGGGSGVWSDANNWAATSGGASGATVPGSSDSVIFDTNSGSASITISAPVQIINLTASGSYAGTLTINSTLLNSGSTVITLTSGMTVTGSGAWSIANGTLTSNGVTIQCELKHVSSGGTWTLADNWTCSAMVTLGAGTSVTLNGKTLICRAGLTIGNASSNVGGTTVIKIAATGTITCSMTGTAALRNPLTFDAGAGTITVSGTLRYGGTAGNTLTYTSGTMVVTGATLQINGSCTLNTNPIVWENVLFGATASVSMTSVLLATTLTLPNANATLSGSSGFTVGTLTNTTITATRSYTFQALVAYRITTAFTTVSAVAPSSRLQFTSSSGTDRALFTLDGGATQDVGFVDPTRMDASGGQPIFTYHGTVVDSPNWNNTANAVAFGGRLAAIGHAG